MSNYIPTFCALLRSEDNLFLKDDLRTDVVEHESSDAPFGDLPGCDAVPLEIQ
jgi:hypothetical protein